MVDRRRFYNIEGRILPEENFAHDRRDPTMSPSPTGYVEVFKFFLYLIEA